MKTPLWFLAALLACLFSPGRSDCQGECLACGLFLQQQQLQQGFSTLVCMLECEGQVSSSLTWELCRRAVNLPQYRSAPEEGALSKATTDEGVELTPPDLDSDDDLLQSATVEHYQDWDLDLLPLKQHSAQYDSLLLGPVEDDKEEEEEGDREARDAPRDSQSEGNAEDAEAISLSKRFGGFLRGRHGYRKLLDPGMRPLQKRYGGFIGVRKSARKWNSQKRVNQLLKQYLGLRNNRSGRFNVGSAAALRGRQNQL